MDNNRQPIIDLLRGMAALTVVIAHASMLFQQIGYLSAGSVLSVITRLSHESVLVFFMLSGYLVGGSVWQKMHAQQFSFPTYVVLRLNRLWLPLIPALLLTAVLDHLGLWYLDYKELMLNLNPFYPDWWHLEWTTSFPVLLSNLLFSQMLLTEQYGTNLSLWTLSNEFWYYLAFPLILLAIYRRSFLAVVLLVLIVLFFISAALNASKPCCTLDRTIIYVTGFVVWCIGAFAAVNKRSSLAWHMVSVVALITGSYCYYNYPNLTFWGDVGFSLLMLPLFIYASRVPMTLPFLFNQLSLMSYSLYLIHLPIIVFFLALTRIYLPWQAWVTTHPMSALLVMMCCVVLIAYLFYKLFESHYHLTAQWLLLRFGRSR